MKRICLMLCLLLLCGCATRGRLAVLDIDLRSAEQIAAYAGEAAAPYTVYGSTTNIAKPAAVTQSIPLGWWEKIIKAIAVLRCRIRILSVEWATAISLQSPAVPVAPVVESKPAYDYVWPYNTNYWLITTNYYDTSTWWIATNYLGNAIIDCGTGTIMPVKLQSDR